MAENYLIHFKAGMAGWQWRGLGKVIQVGLVLVMLLYQRLDCWDYSGAPPFRAKN